MVMVHSPSPGDWTQFLLTPWFEPAHSLVVSYGACLQVFPSEHGVRTGGQPTSCIDSSGDHLAAKHYWSLPMDVCLFPRVTGWLPFPSCTEPSTMQAGQISTVLTQCPTSQKQTPPPSQGAVASVHDSKMDEG